MEPPWDQLYARDVPPDFEEMCKREDRKERIKPFWDSLVNDKEPKVNKESLLRLMQDLKEEGNALFKDSHFDIAWMHYRNAIFVVRILENRFYHTVEKDFTSSLFSNRAFCCLKKNMFKEAVQDCESAIGVFPKNIKAYYRQALAYKHLQMYDEAYKAAFKGQEMQPSTALKELIDELETKVKPEVLKDTRSVESSAKLPSDNIPAVDNEWLVGTNIAVTKKHLEANQKMPKKSKKKKGGTTVSQSNNVIDKEPDTESDDSEPAEYEDDKEFANMLRGVQKNPVTLTSNLMNGRVAGIGGLDITAPTPDDEGAWSFPHDDVVDPLAETEPPIGSMGLDTFSSTADLSLRPAVGDSETSSVTFSDPSSGRSSRASQSPAKYLTAPGPQRQTGPSSSPAPQVAIPHIHFPLMDEYDFKITCRHCFSKIGEGIKGYRYVNAAHQCLRDVLIVKKKTAPGLSWLKIRFRPETKGQFGGYKLCQQFTQNKPCKVGEEKCTFAHHQAEINLWSMDRDGSFSVENFVTLCRTYKIFDNDSLSAQRSRQQYIPGLNYGDNKKKPTLEITDSMNVLSMTSPPSAAVARITNPPPPMNTSIMPPGVPTSRFAAPMMSQPPPTSQTFPQNSGYDSGNRFLPTNSYPSQSNAYGPFGQPPPTGIPSQSRLWSFQKPAVMEEESVITEPIQPVAKLVNPLADTYNIYIVCPNCFKAHNVYPGIYEYFPTPHKCEETILAMKHKNGMEPFIRVRERTNHRDFPGNYILCNSIRYKNPQFCKYGEELCSFAHNDIERLLWTQEKDGKFNITEFLIQNRKYSVSRGFSLAEILIKHGGYFEFICRACYYGTPPKISVVGMDQIRCNGDQQGHSLTDFKIMAHVGPNGFTIINPRGFLHKSAFFKICKWLQFCRSKVNNTCRFAHSMVERDIWMLERDCDIKRSEIVSQSKQGMASPAPAGTPVSSITAGSSASSVSSGYSSSVMSERKQATTTQSADSLGVPASSDGLCPITVLEVCETCWKSGQRTQQQPGKDRCQKGHGNWSCNVIYLLSPSLKELHPLPRKIPSGLNFIICKYIQEGKKCGFTGRGLCQFAHCGEELEAWKFMCANKLTTQAELSEASKAAQKARAESAKSKISGLSVVSSAQTSVGAGPVLRPTMPMTNIHTFYCHYCGVSCNSQKQWDEHCASEKHNFNVNSDKEHQWNYRQPPWTSGKYYDICPKHMNGERCEYSHVPDMYNLCRFAHSQDELDEWRERYEWRLMKREMARQERVFSYMDELLEKYESSTDPVKVICENLEGVDVQTNGELHIYKDEKNATYFWTFEVASKRQMERVALLYNRDRLHFSLANGLERSCQIAQGDIFCHNIDHQGKPLYVIKMQFTGGMFGSFMQWIVFDFGPDVPVLCRKITVEVGNQASHEKIKSLRHNLQFDRWTSLNREIVRHESLDSIEEMLLKKYKEPSDTESVVTQSAITTELNRHNYKPKMHKLLELEEITRHQIISSYNLCVTIECLQAIEGATFVYAMAGELFAKVPLQENLTEDTNAGKLILTSVRKVLLALRSDSSKVVYEASIVNKENFEYDGRGRDFIYLCLSPACVKALNIRHKTNLDVEIQFQMDRLFFCRMHYATDQLLSSDIVFPDVPKINPLRNEKHNLKIASSVLNPDQMSAVRHIVAERTGYTPPFVLFGPFGTGKTETIAQATMVLLKETKDTRILICAQSNSAADLYINKHFDSFLRKSGNQSILRRVYFKDRHLYTVSPLVRSYCLLSPGGDSFKMPSRQDIEKCRIVIVTVTTSLVLANMGLQGMFTHLFIDEAAQTLECESLMPLSLATEKTCIVLAGDHKQISPKVYSEVARNQKFHQSLLERLYNYYDSHSNLISESSPLNILLSINYRTKMEILRFLSAVFYGGPDVLKSEANIRSVVSITPVAFYTVQGREVQDENSVSYYNMSEVQEIVDRVDDLYDKWPEEWGPQSAKEIGVVTPYYDQVLFIRKALKKRNFALKDVMVERVQGVQGKEFRAMFITTVRTSHLIEASHVQSHALTECDGEGGDFGFLSDSKLLNTALTRAQSLVVVVGDPVALCAVGECVNVWRTYLKHCQNMKSLYPQNHTYESIRQQVQNLLNSPARERLLQIANDRQSQQRDGSNISELPYKVQSNSMNVQDHDTRIQQTVGGTGTANDNQMSRLINGNQSGMSSYENSTSAGRSVVVDNSNASMPRNPLTPLNPLRFGMLKQPPPLSLPNQRKVETFYNTGDEFTFDPEEILQQLATLDNIQTAGNIIVQEKNGYAVVRKAGSSSIDGGVIYPSYDINQLNNMAANGEKYVCCKMFIGSKGCKAKILGNSGCSQFIDIPSRWMCGQANNNDEVVLELFSEGEAAFGKVVGVLKRATDLKNRYIVCSVGDTCGMMVPIDEGLCPMFNITTPGKLPNNMDSGVSVYKFTKGKTEIRFSQMEKVNVADRDTKLFVTRFLKWDNHLHLPLCVVVGVINTGTDVNTCMEVLELEHHMKKTYNPDIVEEAEFLYPDNFRITEALCSTRNIDLRMAWCFTVEWSDNVPACKAYSIDEIGDGCYQVGVHITDVTFFVNKNSTFDNEAKNRGFASYPADREPIPMLPKRLAEDLCSLKTNEDRLAISVLMTVKSTGEVTQVNVQKTVVNCKKRFNLKEVEDIINDPTAHEDYLKSCILVLFQISRLWRIDRLGNAALYNENVRKKSTVFAHQLVEEIVIMTEFHVAKIVSGSFPDSTPLLLQDGPDSEALTVWKQQYAADAVNSIALTQPFLNTSMLETCKCGLACTHTVNFVRQSNIVKRSKIDVISVLWDKLREAFDIGDIHAVQNIIVSAENHPQLAVALSELMQLQQSEKVVCRADITADDYHYSINRRPYTRVTEPLSSFMDIAVQRLLLACLDSSASPYSLNEMRAVCFELNKSLVNIKKFEESEFLLQLSSAVLSCPIRLQPVVVNLNLNQVQVCFPNILSAQFLPKLTYDKLGVCKPPVYSNSNVILTWQERIYDYAVLNNQSSVGYWEGELNPDRFIYFVPAFQWQRLLIAIREQDEGTRMQKLNSIVETVRKQVTNPSLEGDYLDDVTSEIQKLGNVKHFTEFSLQMHANQVLLVQMSGRLDNGLLAPYIQLLNLTQRLDICLQHRDQPDKCFANQHSIISPANSQNIKDATSFKKVWSPILELEASTKAVEGGDRVTIHNVPIVWKQNGLHNTITGILLIPLSFMQKRLIKISCNSDLKVLLSPDNNQFCNALFSDYMCVRYNNMTLPNQLGLRDEIDNFVNQSGVFTWVGHCAVMEVVLENDNAILRLQLINSDVPLPVPLVQNRPCTVEIIMRAEDSRMMLYAVNNLEYSSPLAKAVALRQPTINNLTYSDVEIIMQSCKEILPLLNSQQETALKMGLSQPLTVIQGCVGSGKSMMTTKLSVMYATRNSSVSHATHQVLVCAPNETAVDVLDGFFQTLGGSSFPRIVRVYGSDTENVIHPPPRNTGLKMTNTDIDENELKKKYSEFSLYQLIRSSGSTNSEPLIQYETLFSLYPDDITEEQYDKYMELLYIAEGEILKQADIILCTCVTSGLPKITSNTNIQQIIIDDANAGSVPELLIPLSLHNDACQVTLFGDVNQIGPTIYNQTARDLGLGKSLIIDYLSLAVYLNEQYRVHEGIIDFPSKNSYEGRLQCGTRNQRQPSVLNWPAGRTKPACFCKIRGNESFLPLEVNSPAEETIFNFEQAEFAVQVAVALVTSYQVPASNICIICATKAQCITVKDRLSGAGSYVCLTIDQAEGKEFDYVILSTVRTLTSYRIERYPNTAWKKDNLGRLIDRGRVTTVLTRARKGLVIIGNDELLRCDELWGKLLVEYGNSGRMVTKDTFLKSMSM